MEDSVETYSTYALIDDSHPSRKESLEAWQASRKTVADSQRLRAQRDADRKARQAEG